MYYKWYFVIAVFNFRHVLPGTLWKWSRTVVICSITNGIVLVVLNLRGILEMFKVKHRIILSNVVKFA
jgi:hypothetical protein